MDINEKAMQLHAERRGKIEVISRVSVTNREELSLAYTPGVAAPCLAIQANIEKSYDLSRRGNIVAVITDGSAVLGLGNIGPEAAMPVMEGKCCLFKTFAGVDAFPLCIKTQDTDELVKTIHLLSSSFGGINLEDISAPRCFEVEKRLKKLCDIPVFHDDQHGTAIVAGAALHNALKCVGKRIQDVRIIINGAGAAGLSIGNHLLSMGAKNLVMVDKAGIIYEGAPDNNTAQEAIALRSNLDKKQGTLADALAGADVFIGVSAPKLVSADMVRSMARDAILFPMANPTPEIFPEEALAVGARIVGSGRSDYPNQINNVLAFPGIFRGALDVRASDINDAMCTAATYAIAAIVADSELREDYIIPGPFDKRVALAVAESVSAAARTSGVARI